MSKYIGGPWPGRRRMGFNLAILSSVFFHWIGYLWAFWGLLYGLIVNISHFELERIKNSKSNPQLGLAQIKKSPVHKTNWRIREIN